MNSTAIKETDNLCTVDARSSVIALFLLAVAIEFGQLAENRTNKRTSGGTRNASDGARGFPGFLLVVAPAVCFLPFVATRLHSC
jgi:hypothetical protein